MIPRKSAAAAPVLSFPSSGATSSSPTRTAAAAAAAAASSSKSAETGLCGVGSPTSLSPLPPPPNPLSLATLFSSSHVNGQETSLFITSSPSSYCSSFNTGRSSGGDSSAVGNVLILASSNGSVLEKMDLITPSSPRQRLENLFESRSSKFFL